MNISEIYFYIDTFTKVTDEESLNERYNRQSVTSYEVKLKRNQRYHGIEIESKISSIVFTLYWQKMPIPIE